MTFYYVNRGVGGVVNHVLITPLESSDSDVSFVMGEHQARGRGAWLRAQAECRPGDRVGAAGEVLERVEALRARN